LKVADTPPKSQARQHNTGFYTNDSDNWSARRQVEQTFANF
jgi:hypothetical protein